MLGVALLPFLRSQQSKAKQTVETPPYTAIFFFKKSSEAGKVAQLLRELTALPEGLNSVPGIHI